MSNTEPKELPQTGYIRLATLLMFIPVSASTIWRWCKAGTFPAPKKLSENITVWKAEQIQYWIAEQDKNTA